MASIKTIELRCPHCGHKISSMPRGDTVTIFGKSTYGDPHQTCPKCGKTFLHSFASEAVEGLTLRQRVPLWATGPRLLVAEVIPAIFSLVLLVLDPELFGIPLAVIGGIAGLHLLFSLLTRSSRQKHKDQVLLASRERMRDPEYFMGYLAGKLSQESFAGLSPQVCMALHQKYLETEQRDEVFDLQQAFDSLR